QVRKLGRNRRRAKARSAAGWARLRSWGEYDGRLHGSPVVAVPPHDTSQVCSGCGQLVRTSLSVRTPSGPSCGWVLDRDHTAALVSREAGLAHATAQGIWDPVTHSSLGKGTTSGTVGHTGPYR